MSTQPALCDEPRALERRIAALDWSAIGRSLDERGHAVVAGLLSTHECRAIAQRYGDAAQFRSRVVMARYSFGRGEYQYFAYPLPAAVAALRTALYAPLSAVANRWNERLSVATRFPEQHTTFLERCHSAGQTRPTPLLLDYGPGDYNCLHQDLYGEHVFPLQATVLLSAPDEEFAGGEFVLAEQRPRRQSRVEVVPLGRGDAVIFAAAQRPVAGPRGTYRVNMRHGVSSVRSGSRRTLGIVFHDAS